MLRRFALLAALVAVASFVTVIVTTPADAAVTSSTITSPKGGTHFLLTSNLAGTVTVAVKGTTDGTGVDHVDIRCYYRPGSWNTVQANIPVASNGTFSTTMRKDDAYGTCVLRAVPAGFGTGSAAAFKGVRVTTEWIDPERIESGPNAGKLTDYYVLFQGAHAMNDYSSAGDGGLWDSRLQFSNGYSSTYLWFGNGILSSNEANLGAGSGLRVDGHYAYVPHAAENVLPDNPGLRSLTFSASRNNSTGTTTIHEIDPVVVCPTDTYPPTSFSCPHFDGAGVRLERTMVTTDGGRQVRITDVWRSTDSHAHTVSAHYDQWNQGYYPTSQPEKPIGIKLPWTGAAYRTFTSEVTYPGTSSVPASIFVRGNNNAANGNTLYPRGAISVDFGPHEVHRVTNRTFTLRDEGIKVPAGGTHLIRQAFVMGSSDSEIATKAAAQRRQINPYRPDGLLKKKSASSYIGNHIYNTTGLHQTVLAKRSHGSRATFDIKVQNDGTATDNFRLRGPGSKPGFGVRYLFGASGTSDITFGVTHGTFKLTNLAPGQSRVIRLVVTVKPGAGIGTVSGWLVTARSTHDTNRKDAVRAKVQVI